MEVVEGRNAKRLGDLEYITISTKAKSLDHFYKRFMYKKIAKYTNAKMENKVF